MLLQNLNEEELDQYVEKSGQFLTDPSFLLKLFGNTF